MLQVHADDHCKAIEVLGLGVCSSLLVGLVNSQLCASNYYYYYYYYYYDDDNNNNHHRHHYHFSVASQSCPFGFFAPQGTMSSSQLLLLQRLSGNMRPR